MPFGERVNPPNAVIEPEVVVVGGDTHPLLEAFRQLRIAPLPGLDGVKVELMVDSLRIESFILAYDATKREGKPFHVYSSHYKTVGSWDEWAGVTAAKEMRTALRGAYLHEIDECLQNVSGQAIFDPHTRERMRNPDLSYVTA